MLTYFTAEALGGNGFIAAFVAGIAAGTVGREEARLDPPASLDPVALGQLTSAMRRDILRCSGRMNLDVVGLPDDATYYLCGIYCPTWATSAEEKEDGRKRRQSGKHFVVEPLAPIPYQNWRLEVRP